MESWKNILTAILIFLIIGIVIITTSWYFLQPPNEEYCQKFHGNDRTISMYAERSWCEYNNETGWHFNRTAFNKSWSGTETYVRY